MRFSYAEPMIDPTFYARLNVGLSLLEKWFDAEIHNLENLPNSPFSIQNIATPSTVVADKSGKLTDIRTEKNTSQFGLVEEAGPANTALLDVTGDGAPREVVERSRQAL